MLKYFAAIAIVLFSFPALSETRYLSDELRVPLRSSPCSRCAIERVLSAGTRLEVLETNDEGWSRVATRGGQEGWLPSQYLVSQPIARDRLAAMSARVEELEAQNSQLNSRISELEAQNRELQERLSGTLESESALETELAEIKQVSSNALSLRDQNQELLKRNRILQSEIDVLTATRDELRSDKAQKWFLYGGVAVFLGALLVILIPRLKPRKRFSEWA
jgi:SH3 domain protein